MPSCRGPAGRKQAKRAPQDLLDALVVFADLEERADVLARAQRSAEPGARPKITPYLLAASGAVAEAKAAASRVCGARLLANEPDHAHQILRLQ